VRMKRDTEVEDPDGAMSGFTSLLRNLMKVPKSEVVEAKRKRKAPAKRKRKT
jgi:hypothetical protein